MQSVDIPHIFFVILLIVCIIVYIKTPRINGRLHFVGRCLTEAEFERISTEANRIIRTTPARKPPKFTRKVRKGRYIQSKDLPEYGDIKQLYTSPAFISQLSSLTGLDLRPAPDNDASSCGILVYSEPGDFIGWHTDPNHFHGNRIVVLISLVNEKTSGGLSSSWLHFKDDSNKVAKLQMPPNSMVVFNGSQVPHYASPLHEDERRIILSMTYCDTCVPSVLGIVSKNVKEWVLGG
jgi:alkylated DNA repair dioxygenase AlkB